MKQDRKVPLSMVLLIPFILLSLSIALSVRFIAYYSSRQSVNDVVSELRREINKHIKDQLTSFFELPHLINGLNAELIDSGILPADDQAALIQHFQKQVELFPTVTSIYFGSSSGGVANAGREMDDREELYRYIITTENFERGVFTKYRTDESGNPAEVVSSLPDFDARSRNWYIRAAESGATVWSDVYIPFTGQNLAISASRPAYSNEGELLGVLSVDIFLTRLDTFLSDLVIGKTGQSFIMERSGNLIATSTGEHAFREDSEADGEGRIAAASCTNPIIRNAASRLAADFGRIATIAETSHFDFILDGDRFFGQVLPLNGSGIPDWLIVTVIPESDFTAQIMKNKLLTDSIILIILFVIIVAGSLLTTSISRPIYSLEQYFRQLAEGRWDEQVSISSRIREISTLARTGNFMAGVMTDTLEGLNREVADRRRAETGLEERNAALQKTLQELEAAHKQIIQQERLASIGHLSSGIAHDFNNMLEIISGYTEIVRDLTADSEEIGEHLGQIDTAARRSADLVRQLLAFARRQPVHPKIIDLNETIGDSIVMLQRLIGENIKLFWRPGSGIDPVEIDPTQITQILTNLAVNSRDAITDTGTILIETESGVQDQTFSTTPASDDAETGNDAPSARAVILKFSDTGSGMDEVTLSRVFEPFFTSKDKGKGTGLGLSTVYGIVKQNRGDILLESNPGRGTKVTIRLPAAETKISEAEFTGSSSFRGSETVMLVEDEDGVRKLTSQMLIHMGYSVIACRDPEEALRTIESYADPIALMITDVVMPQMNGFELYERISLSRPELRVLYISGYPTVVLEEQAVKSEQILLLPKPFTREELSAWVHRALNEQLKPT